MANRTVKDAQSIKGTNPQYLVEKIIRSRIYDSRYWKEECFALTAELLVDKAMEVRSIGGVFGGNVKPTSFLCLILKMLQIQPEKDIIIEFIRQEEFKYVRCLGALYMRLTGTSLDCYKYLEPLYNDYRKIRRQNRQGTYELVHMDEFIDELLHEERVCDCILPRIQKRYVMEENNQLERRISALEDDLDDIESEEEENEKTNIKEVSQSAPLSSASAKEKRSRHDESNSRSKRSPGAHHHRSSRRSSPPPSSESRKHRSRSRDRHRSRRSRSKERKDHKRRSRSKSPGHESKREKKHKSKHSRKDRHRDKDQGSSLKDDIAEANSLRARLGLPPLRP